MRFDGIFLEQLLLLLLDLCESSSDLRSSLQLALANLLDVNLYKDHISGCTQTCFFDIQHRAPVRDVGQRLVRVDGTDLRRRVEVS